MTRENLKIALAVLVVGAVFYVGANIGLSIVQDMPLIDALLFINEATLFYSFLGGLACVMLWRNR